MVDDNLQDEMPNKDASTTTPSDEDKQAKREAGRARVITGVAAASFDTVQERVAWILNNYPEARDSDITLQLRYWEHFEDYDGGVIEPEELYEFARLNTLTRARAKIQNEFKLFVASPEVAQFRGTLDEEEREKVREQKAHYPVFAVYADESGKTGSHLIVGSMWFAHGPETFEIARRILAWRDHVGFTSELHFKEINRGNVDRYIEFIDLFLANAASVSFKAITVPRPGIRDIDAALQDLFVHLLVRGVQHEHDTGRAELPRSIQLWKDADEQSRDALMLANIGERLEAASEARFDGNLNVDALEAVDSKSLDLIQVTDLFTGSINRVLNSKGSQHPKDVVASHLLSGIGIPEGPDTEEREGDLTVLLKL